MNTKGKRVLITGSSGGLGSSERFFHLRISSHPVAQSAPFQVMLCVFSSYAQRILFKCFVELRDGWRVGHWRSDR